MDSALTNPFMWTKRYQYPVQLDGVTLYAMLSGLFTYDVVVDYASKTIDFFIFHFELSDFQLLRKITDSMRNSAIKLSIDWFSIFMCNKLWIWLNQHANRLYFEWIYDQRQKCYVFDNKLEFLAFNTKTFKIFNSIEIGHWNLTFHINFLICYPNN